MYLLGHVGSAVLIWHLFEKLRGETNFYQKFLFATGVMLPDFLDKSIGSFVFKTGRWLGHSFSFQFGILLVLLGINRLKFENQHMKEIFILYLGSILHVIGDLPGIDQVVMFWPIFGPFPIEQNKSFLFGFQDLTIVTLEITGFLIVILIGKIENWTTKMWKIYFGIVIIYFFIFIIVYSFLVGY